MKKARLFKQVGSRQKIRCSLCPRQCLIANGETGICGVRQNQDGVLYSDIYGKVTSSVVELIEKRQLYHFWPGNLGLTLSSIGCNLKCQYCQNWQISQAPNQNLKIPFTIYSPEEIVQLAIKNYCKLLVFAYHEPTIWYEYILDTGKKAHEEKLKVALSTSGYVSLEAIKELSSVVDAVVVDVKGFNDKAYRKICGVPSKKPVLDALKAFKEEKVHLEISYLVIPERNDQLADIRSMCEWVENNLGDTTPIHFSPFFPAFRMLNVPQTPYDALDNAYKIAKSIGLKHVYLTNRLGTQSENTICPKCQKEIIVREAGEITQWNLTGSNTCKFCETPFPIRGEYTKSTFLWRKTLL